MASSANSFMFPALTVLIAFQRAFLIRFKHTSPITAATALEVGGIILGLYAGVRLFDLPGIYAATGAFLFGRIIANLYLSLPYRRVSHRVNHPRRSGALKDLGSHKAKTPPKRVGQHSHRTGRPGRQPHR